MLDIFKRKSVEEIDEGRVREEFSHNMSLQAVLDDVVKYLHISLLSDQSQKGSFDECDFLGHSFEVDLDC